MMARCFSSLMRVKSFSPSATIVADLSNGRFAYIVPPGKWHGWHLPVRIGVMSFSKETGFEVAAAIVAMPRARIRVTRRIRDSLRYVPFDAPGDASLLGSRLYSLHMKAI